MVAPQVREVAPPVVLVAREVGRVFNFSIFNFQVFSNKPVKPLRHGCSGSGAMVAREVAPWLLRRWRHGCSASRSGFQFFNFQLFSNKPVKPLRQPGGATKTTGGATLPTCGATMAEHPSSDIVQ